MSYYSLFLNPLEVKKTLESGLFSPEDAPYPEDMARLFARFMFLQSRFFQATATMFPRRAFSFKLSGLSGPLGQVSRKDIKEVSK